MCLVNKLKSWYKIEEWGNYHDVERDIRVLSEDQIGYLDKKRERFHTK